VPLLFDRNTSSGIFNFQLLYPAVFRKFRRRSGGFAGFAGFVHKFFLQIVRLIKYFAQTVQFAGKSNDSTLSDDSRNGQGLFLIC
jgi:hypothetical protein